MVISSFAILAVLVTLTIAASLKGSRKSESSSRVRTELEYALGIIERQIRNGTSLTCDSTTGEVSFQDSEGVTAGFVWRTEEIDEVDHDYIASRSADTYSHLTGSAVNISQFTAECSGEIVGQEGVPQSVKITLTGESVGETGSQGSQVTIDTEVMLRNY